MLLKFLYFASVAFSFTILMYSAIMFKKVIDTLDGGSTEEFTNSVDYNLLLDDNQEYDNQSKIFDAFFSFLFFTSTCTIMLIISVIPFVNIFMALDELSMIKAHY